MPRRRYDWAAAPCVIDRIRLTTNIVSRRDFLRSIPRKYDIPNNIVRENEIAIKIIANFKVFAASRIEELWFLSVVSLHVLYIVVHVENH